jgi:hypothetical protein
MRKGGSSRMETKNRTLSLVFVLVSIATGCATVQPLAIGGRAIKQEESMKERVEELIFPAKVRKVKDGPYEDDPLYHKMKECVGVGDPYVFNMGPGEYISYEISKIDETGIYGYVLRNTVEEMAFDKPQPKAK